MPKTMKEIMETDMNGMFSFNDGTVEPVWLIDMSDRFRAEIGINEDNENGPLACMLLDLELTYMLYGYIKGYKLARAIEGEIKGI